MASSSSGFVAGLTAAAVAVVGFLAYQASANAPADLGRPSSSASPSPERPKKSEQPDKDGKGGTSQAAALPDSSGSGERVVYSLGRDRVWLVGASGKVRRTFEVTPSTVDPAPNTYTVTSRQEAATGSDGTAIEHIVRFATVDGVTVGFSAAVDGSTPEPDPGSRTGGIRESREDGRAMWDFAVVGRKVVVVE